MKKNHFVYFIFLKVLEICLHIPGSAKNTQTQIMLVNYSGKLCQVSEAEYVF